MQANPPSKKMSSKAFSEYVMGIDDLYDMTLRNGFFLPKKTSTAVNEVMLYNVLQGNYWCLKYKDLKLQPCVKPPVKETLVQKIQTLCKKNNLNIAWIDDKHLPNKEWMVSVVSTLNPDDEIFKKDYVAPPVRKRLRDIETIVLPNELFENLPKSSSKLKKRRLKIMSEAFAAEKASKLKEMQKDIYEELVIQEERMEKYQTMKRAKVFDISSTQKEEEKKQVSNN